MPMVYKYLYKRHCNIHKDTVMSSSLCAFTFSITITILIYCQNHSCITASFKSNNQKLQQKLQNVCQLLFMLPFRHVRHISHYNTDHPEHQETEKTLTWSFWASHSKITKNLQVLPEKSNGMIFLIKMQKHVIKSKNLLLWRFLGTD